MKTAKQLFGILAVTTALLTGCGSGEEIVWGYMGSNLDLLRQGQPIVYRNPEKDITREGFVLPEKAIISSGLQNWHRNEHEIDEAKRGLEADVREFYWDVRFLDEQKMPRQDKKGRDVWDYTVRLAVKKKKTPEEIEMCRFLCDDLHIRLSDLNGGTISTGATADLAKKYGEPKATALIAKIQSRPNAAGRIESKELVQPSPAPSWGTPQEKALVGTYQSVNPPYVLWLSYSGKVSTQNLESGDRNDGKWFIQDGSLVTIWDSNGSKTTYEINSDGSFKSSHGILFVKTQQ